MKTLKYHLTRLWEAIQYHLRFLYRRRTLSQLGVDPELADDLPIIQTSQYLVKANPWGEWKIRKKDLVDFYIFIGPNGWAFRTPGRNYGVIGYPSITFQNHSEKVGQIQKMRVKYNLRLVMEKYRKYNLAFDFWIGRAPEFSWPNIVHEVMVWDDYRVARPFGKYVDTVVFGGAQYRVYTGYIDKSAEKLGVDGWQYTAFLRLERTHASTLDVALLLRYLYHQGMIDPHHYLLRSEFGNEVYNANGFLELKEFWVKNCSV